MVAFAPLTLILRPSARAGSRAWLAALTLATLLPAALAERAEYRVLPGDTAYSVARRHGLTVEALLTLNGLSSTALSVGQVLLVEVETSSSGTGATTPAPTTPASVVPAAPATYTVVAGDTLFGVARRVGATVQELTELNGLENAALRVGQILRLPRPVPAQSATQTAAQNATPPAGASTTVGPFSTATPAVKTPTVVPVTPTATTPSSAPEGASPVVPPAESGDVADPVFAVVREAALAYLGVPYVLGGTTPRGLDCSGLVLNAFAKTGLSLPRRSADMFSVGLPVDRAALRPGDLVFFDTEGRGAVSHVGIYLGGEVFVHANTYAGRVTVSAMSEKYYADRYRGARRVMGPNALR